MSEYVMQCFLEIDGKTIDDFKQVTEKEVEIYKQIALMNKTGFGRVTPRYGATVDYVVPETDPEFDFRSVRNGRLTIEFNNGKRITYVGVYPLTIGELTIDGENEAVRTIDFGAADKIEE